MPRLRTLAFASLLASLAMSTPLAHAAAKFEPADGKTLLIVGQEKHEIADYWRSVGPAGGYMLYTSLASLSGMDGDSRGSGCSDSGVMSFPDWVKHYPDTVAQIGLYMVGMLPEVIDGDLDGSIEELAETLRATKRPVFLRIGYEFDGPWNRYDPDLYKQAWQRMVRIFRGETLPGMKQGITPVTNVAFVWHSAAYKRHQGAALDAWYPGDEFVDWIALSWFEWGPDNDKTAAAQARDEVLAFTKARRKPLMIAEAAAKQYHEADQRTAWEGWHRPVFDWIATHNVKAYSYINQDWNKMPQWRNASCGNGTDWGDTRVQKPGSRLLDTWKKTVESPRWLRQGPALMRAIGATKP